jgi:hypothetical protein
MRGDCRDRSPLFCSQTMMLLWFVLVLFVFREMNVMAVDMSTEGFFNVGNQPGSPDDPRGIPNIPYSTDTNRFSDGVTSDATVDITSPHFPIYHGYSVIFIDMDIALFQDPLPYFLWKNVDYVHSLNQICPQ